jgi:DeoR family transcriptional regulator of aga operon
LASNPRHDQIITLLQKLRSLTVQELTERLGVSPVTIRKDLTLLEDQGIIIRSHGAAKLAQDSSGVTNLSRRSQVHTQQKNLIAHRALELIQDGDTIYLDSGSTTAALAQLLRGRPIRVVTNSLQVLNILADDPDLSLIAVGGNYRLEAGSFIGPGAMETVARYQMDIGFLGATAFSAKGMFYSQNVIESQLKETVLAHCSRRVILADSSKFGISAFSLFARPDKVDVLVSDTGLGEDHRLGLGDLGIEVVVGED